MQIFTYQQPGVVCGAEHGSELFVRLTEFPQGYCEAGFHSHPSTFEYYIILEGSLVFESEGGERVRLSGGSMVYFVEAEPHRIVQVDEAVKMLLFKKTGSEKVN